LVGVRIGVSVGPLAERGLDEALGLAISLWSIRSCEAMFDMEGGDGEAHGMGTVTGAVVGVNTRNGDAMGGEEGEGSMEEGESTGGGFIWEKFGEGEATVIVDGDVKIFPTGAADVVVLAVAGDAMACADNPSEFLDVEVEEIAWMKVLVANDWRRRGKLSKEKAMAVEDAGDGGLGKLGEASDLEGREFAATEGEHAGDPQRVGSFGGTFGTRTAIKETC